MAVDDLHAHRAVGVVDAYLAQRLVARHVEAAAERVVERDLDAAPLAADEQYARCRAAVESGIGRGGLPPGIGAWAAVRDIARDEEQVAQLAGRRLGLHDAVRVPPRRAAFDRLAGCGEGYVARHEAYAAAAEEALQAVAQIGRQDVALNERVAHEGYAHGLSVDHAVDELLEPRAWQRVEILDRNEVFGYALLDLVDGGYAPTSDRRLEKHLESRLHGRLLCEGVGRRLRHGGLLDLDCRELLFETLDVGLVLDDALSLVALEAYQAGQYDGAVQPYAENVARRDECRGDDACRGRYDRQIAPYRGVFSAFHPFSPCERI